MATITLTHENFEETVLAEGITIVDFWADWCAPCKMFGPVFEKVSEAHPSVRFAKVDTEAEQGLSAALSIRSIPTVMIFRDGILLMNEAGALSEFQLEQYVIAAEGLDMEAVRREIDEAEAAGENE